ncbi:MAG: tetratricopeptide repeat protein [Bryobacteraceae bacterium]|nr:tetratricopeptide repeat protein [Bryobacterales bacterium]MEB2360197.1 tetratricopeptide repeat protein [Bryobacterales bacterium]NUN03014.1 tetratricopeptide repeat protein [Bryobacteraceae bacterium]
MNEAIKKFVTFSAISAVVFPGCLYAQANSTGPTVDKPRAYYNYAMGHLYAEQAAAFGNRGDYLDKAIEHFKQAIKADPNASFLSDELSDLYIQAGRLREGVMDAEEILRQNPQDINARRILGRIYTRMIGDPQQNKVDEGMAKKAIEQYQKIAEQAPKDADTWLMLGRLHKITQNSVEAEKAYAKILEFEPDNEDAMAGLAMVYADLGDSKRAVEMLQKVADKNPSLRTLMALAGSYEQMREYALAAETLKQALKLAPENGDIRRGLAQDLLLSDQYDEALKLYSDLAAEDPKDYQVQLRISQIYRQKRDFTKAHEASKQALKLQPENLEVQYNEVNLLDAEDRTKEAIEKLTAILAASAKRFYNASEKGNRAALLERLGMMYRSIDQPAEAVEAFQELAQLDDELGPRASAHIIDTWRAAKDYTKARQEADAAIQRYPNDRVLGAVRASLLADLGNPEQAVSELKKLMDGKADREIYLSIAQVWEKAKNYTAMKEAVEQADKLSSTNEEKEAIHFTRGAMYERMKQYDASEAEFRKVLEMNPENSSALNYLGYMLADRNVRLQEAHDLIVKALDKEPNNGAYLDSMGWVYYRMGKLDKAEDFLLRALDKAGRDPTVREHLADVYFQQGKLKEAIAQWELSLREWRASAPSEQDPQEIAKIQKKLENARVRLARENSATPVNQQ